MKRDKALQEFIAEKGQGTPGIYLGTGTRYSRNLSMKRNKVLQEFIYEKGRGTPGIYSMKRNGVLQEFTL